MFLKQEIDLFTFGDIEIAGLLKKDVKKDLSKIVTLDKIVTSKKILNNILKDHLVKQAYNDKDKNNMLTQLLMKLLYNVLKTSITGFAIYHP